MANPVKISARMDLVKKIITVYLLLLAMAFPEFDTRDSLPLSQNSRIMMDESTRPELEEYNDSF